MWRYLSGESTLVGSISDPAEGILLGQLYCVDEIRLDN